MESETVAGIVAEGDVFTDVTWTQITDSEFLGCTFVGASFSAALLGSSRFVECHFERCDLSLWKPVDSVIGGCRFEDCRMLGVDWTQAVWPPVPLHEPNRLTRCELSMGTFTDLDLGPVTFEECRLHEVSYRAARLAGASFEESDCRGADFDSADLTDANLVGVRDLFVDPRRTKLEGATIDTLTGLVILEALGLNLTTTGEPGADLRP